MSKIIGIVAVASAGMVLLNNFAQIYILCPARIKMTKKLLYVRVLLLLAMIVFVLLYVRNVLRCPPTHEIRSSIAEKAQD